MVAIACISDFRSPAVVAISLSGVKGGSVQSMEGPRAGDLSDMGLRYPQLLVGCFISTGPHTTMVSRQHIPQTSAGVVSVTRPN
jgi:hypothetical protein